MFKLSGGDAALNVGFEYRQEDYMDQYDSLSEAGEILGSSGNSAGGSRSVRAFSGEMLFPILKNLEASLSARYEDYSDYGSDFSPKASFKFKPIPTLALRGSAGRGFRAPSLDILTANVQFSAESIEDARTCAVLACTDNAIQRDTFFISNPELSSEKSTQFSLGALWDVTPNFSVSADYWQTKISDVISTVTAQELVDRDNGDDPRPVPPGLGVVRNPVTGAISQINAGYANEGTVKLNGIDLSMIYNWKLDTFGKFGHNFTWSHTFEYDDDGVDLAGTQAYPKDRGTLSNTWALGEFSAIWNFNLIGKNGEITSAGVDRRVGTYVTNDLQFNWDPGAVKGARFTVGAINLGDKQPELVRYDGRNFNFYLYDSYGRQVYVRYTQKF
jgi:iron complex outermembrane receptor protein